MLKMCQNALRALAAALLLSLTAATGALAQSEPIKVGVGLALTGAGADRKSTRLNSSHT